MSQMVNTEIGAPVKKKPPKPTKEQKQATRLARKARRAEQLAKKAEQETAIALATLAIGIVTGKVTAADMETKDAGANTDAGSNTDLPAGDGDGAVGGVAGDEAATDAAAGTAVDNDPQPAAEPVVASDATPNCEVENVAEVTPAEPTLEDLKAQLEAAKTAKAELDAAKPADMSNKKWKDAKWRALSKVAALGKLVKDAEASYAEAPLPVVPQGADFVSSVNAEYDSTTVEKAANAETTETSASENTPAADSVQETETESPAEVTESPADEAQSEPVKEADDEEAQTVEKNTPAEKPPEPEVPAEVAKPTLVVNNTPAELSAEQKKYVEAAEKFYGDAFTDERRLLLTDAYRLLMMAVRSEGSNTKMVEVALRNALIKENEAFAVKFAKAA